MRVFSNPHRVAPTLAVILLAAGLTSCVDAGASEEKPTQSEWFEEPVTVTVDLNQSLVTVPPYALGIHTSVYDNALHDEELPQLLEAAGIALLRYPGGGYSDNYHWSTHTMTSWSPGNAGYLAPRSDFGSYVSVLERTVTAAMITVNYGSNLSSDGPGEPKEAAAWVAYANGDPDDDTVIGEDGTGYDWQTVGYWASLRAADPLPPPEDGSEPAEPLDFLRISHPEPLGIQYWEVGNEVFGNGYYGDGREFELDLHVPYDGTTRQGHPDLSPATYGGGVVEYVRAMKAVDPTIKVGAVLVTPPMDYGWAPEWNDEVLTECGEEIDFAIVHWYAARDVASLLRAPRTQLPLIMEELEDSFAEHRAENTTPIEVAVTELGPTLTEGINWNSMQVTGLFAADVYASFIEHGVANIDWLELHNGSFLSERSARTGPAYNGIRMVHLLAGPGDRLVQATSSDDNLTVHAALREDDAAGLLLINTARTTLARVTIEIDGRALHTAGDLYHYRPEGDAENGAVVGPVAVDEVGNSFTVEVPPYSATTLHIPVAE